MCAILFYYGMEIIPICFPVTGSDAGRPQSHHYQYGATGVQQGSLYEQHGGPGVKQFVTVSSPALRPAYTAHKFQRLPLIFCFWNKSPNCFVLEFQKLLQCMQTFTHTHTHTLPSNLNFDRFFAVHAALLAPHVTDDSATLAGYSVGLVERASNGFVSSCNLPHSAGCYIQCVCMLQCCYCNSSSTIT